MEQATDGFEKGLAHSQFGLLHINQTGHVRNLVLSDMKQHIPIEASRLDQPLQNITAWNEDMSLFLCDW